jgi:hypothetical protein
VCQVPVVHQRGDNPQILVHMTDGRSLQVEGLMLDREVSAKIFRRSHEVSQLTVIA